MPVLLLACPRPQGDGPYRPDFSGIRAGPRGPTPVSGGEISWPVDLERRRWKEDHGYRSADRDPGHEGPGVRVLAGKAPGTRGIDRPRGRGRYGRTEGQAGSDARGGRPRRR